MILHSSYGYDMTINHYYKIVQDGEKTVLLQEIGKIVTKDDGMGNGRSYPDETKLIGKQFRAHKRLFMDRIIFRSKYITGGSADEWDGRPDYYNTWD